MKLSIEKDRSNCYIGIEEREGNDRNLGVKVQMVLKALRLDEITMGV